MAKTGKIKRMNPLRTLIFSLILISGIFLPLPSSAQELIQDKVEIVKAKVVEVISQEKKEVPGTDIQSTYQTIRAEILEGDKKGSGRAGFVEETWAKDAAIDFLQSEQTKTMDKKDVSKKNDYNYTEGEIAELLKNLDPLAYHVVAENGTESPFNNAYWNNKADGIYVDVVTGKPLFSSTHKYDSGTDWPSFWRTIDDDSVTMHEDNSLSTSQTEIRSDAEHVGHVFEDGPQEEGGRLFCTNSASLKFVSKEEMEKGGYGFSPDFVLFLRRREDKKIESRQIFIEPKDEIYIKNEPWKQELILSLEKEAKIIHEWEEENFKILSLPFYNEQLKREFEEALENKILA